MTLLHRAPSHAGPWHDRHLWYQATPSEIPDTASALALISSLARLGINVITMPALAADADPNYVPAVLSRGARRGLRIIPNVGAEAMAARDAGGLSNDERYAILSQWFERGATGIELGRDTLTGSAPTGHGAHHHSGWDVRELQAWMKFHNDDAVLSVSLRAESLEEITHHAFDDYFDVLRFNVVGTPPLTAKNFFDQAGPAFHLYDAAGLLPSWNATWEVLDNISGQLSHAGLLLATTFMPGILHFEQDIHMHGPSTRHAIRMRDSLQIYRAHVLIDESKATDGLIYLVTERADMLINFGPDEYEIPNDGRVLISSMITLPDRGSNLAVPPGEVAWLHRNSCF